MGCACFKQDVVIKNNKNSKENKNVRNDIIVIDNNRPNIREHNREVSNNLSNNINANMNSYNLNNINPNYVQRDIGSRNNNIHNRNSRSLRNQDSDINNVINSNEPYLQSKNNPDFNLPESSESYSGKGLKKMKGYICKFTPEELKRKRIEFWGTRTEGNVEVWQFLENICSSNEYDDQSIKGFLAALEIRPYKDCINICYDNAGAIYEIPNYCINDPIEYDIVTSKSYKNRPAEKEIKLKVKNYNTSIEINCKNTNTVLELKGKVFSSGKFDAKSVESIRMFYGGKELHNIEELWFYSIDDESSIQVMYII